MQPRTPLPASVSTVLLYLSHLSQEGEVREGSLSPYLAAVNQMHQDAGFRRPSLGHYVDLLRKGFANVEAQETFSAPVRMPLPPAVVCRLQYVFNVSNRLARIGSVWQI
jgi:hypothetical protein